MTTKLIDARKAMWAGTRVQLHIELRRAAAYRLAPWRLDHYGETAIPLRSNYVHDFWTQSGSNGDSIRTYTEFLKEWADIR